MANRYSLSENLIILCGHYKGIDHRIREHLITKEITIGDFCAYGVENFRCYNDRCHSEAYSRAIGDEIVGFVRLFQDNLLLAPPVYTRPADYNGWKVPDILLSGIRPSGRMESSTVGRAYKTALRPDLLEE